MPRRLLVLLATLALPLGLLAAVPSPAVSAAAPTVRPLPASSQAGRTLTLRGTAPPRSVVSVQRRYGYVGAFTRVRSVRANRSGAWSARVRLVTAGATLFRAVAGGRASAFRALDVYQWLYLMDQPFGSQGGDPVRYNLSRNVGATRLPRSIEAAGVGHVIVPTGGHCSQLRFTSGIADSDRRRLDGDEQVTGEVQQFSGDGPVGDPLPFQVLAGDGARGLSFPLTTRTATLGIRFVAVDPDGLPLWSVLGSPRVLCDIPRLFQLTDDAFPA